MKIRQFCRKINLIVKLDFIKIMSIYYVIGGSERYFLGSWFVFPVEVQGISIVRGDHMLPTKPADHLTLASKCLSQAH